MDGLVLCFLPVMRVSGGHFERSFFFFFFSLLVMMICPLFSPHSSFLLFPRFLSVWGIA